MRALDDPILTILRDLAGLTVHDGEPPVKADDSTVVTSPVPYLSYYSNLGVEEVPRLTGRRSRHLMDFRVTFVGITRTQAKAAGQRARGALVGRRIAVPGTRGSGRIQVESSQLVVPDRSARLTNGSRLYYGVDDFSVTAGLSR